METIRRKRNGDGGFRNYEGQTKTLSRRENNYQLLYSLIGRSRSFGGRDGSRSGKSNEHRPELPRRVSRLPKLPFRGSGVLLLRKVISRFVVVSWFRGSGEIKKEKERKGRKDPKETKFSFIAEIRIVGRTSLSDRNWWKDYFKIIIRFPIERPCSKVSPWLDGEIMPIMRSSRSTRVENERRKRKVLPVATIFRSLSLSRCSTRPTFPLTNL